jgi:hypothetical protein
VRVAALGIAALMSYASPLRWASSEWDRTRFLEEPNGELTAGRISRRCPQSGPLVPEQRISPHKSASVYKSSPLDVKPAWRRSVSNIAHQPAISEKPTIRQLASISFVDERVGDLSSIDVAEAWNAVCAQFSRNF